MLELSATFDKERHMMRLQLGDSVGYFPLDDTESFMEKMSVVIETAKYDEGQQSEMARKISHSLTDWERMMDAPTVEGKK